MDRDRQTATLHYEMLTVWEMKPRTTTQKTSRLLMGPVQEFKPCKLWDYVDDDDDDEIEQLPAMCDSKSSSYRNKQYGDIVKDIS
jgi:hypothetical protein